tara:strand:- start:1179 stop:1457 length:279 start_codon:yes stop_codon:yes gene_type:complete
MVEEVIVEVKHYPLYIQNHTNKEFSGQASTERMIIPAWIEGQIDEDKVNFCVKSASPPNVGNGYFAVAEYIDEQLKMAHRISDEWSFVMEVA